MRTQVAREFAIPMFPGNFKRVSKVASVMDADASIGPEQVSFPLWASEFTAEITWV
jgi:hypothetical protein